MEKKILYENTDNKSIELSIGIPCYNGKKIGWLCMEGLCNQADVDFGWEIIICEENHDNMLGVDFFKQYIDRLSKVGCKKITYLYLNDWVNLAEKWKIIGKNLDNYNGGFVLQAIDCYPPSKRLSITNELIKKYDWIDFGQGYFYSFLHKKIILYKRFDKKNLHMTFKSKYAKRLGSYDKNIGIDGFLLKTIKKINPKMEKYTHKELLSDGLDTDGYNNISKNRVDYYENTREPFFKTDVKLEQIGLPNYVLEQIKKI